MSKHSCNFCKHLEEDLEATEKNLKESSCKTRIGDGVAFIEALDTTNLIPNRAVALDKPSSIKVLNFLLTKEEDRNTALKTQKCWLSQSVFNALFNFVFMTSTNNKIQ